MLYYTLTEAMQNPQTKPQSKNTFLLPFLYPSHNLVEFTTFYIAVFCRVAAFKKLSKTIKNIYCIKAYNDTIIKRIIIGIEYITQSFVTNKVRYIFMHLQIKLVIHIFIYSFNYLLLSQFNVY